MPSNHLILCHHLLLLPSIFPSIRVFSNESALCIRWPKYWSFSFSISPSNKYSGWISFGIEWFDLLAVLGTLESFPSFKETHLVQLHSSVWLFVSPWMAACQVSLFNPSSGVCSNPCTLSQWCHPAISSSVIPFSSWFQSFPESGSFPMSQLFVSGGQSVGVSASASVLPMNIQDWFPLGWTCWISLQSKGLSRVFSNTTIQKHQFFRCSAFFIV